MTTINPRKVQKSKFTTEDDILLTQLVLSSQVIDWASIASRMPNRNPRQCRERWQNYLDPKLVQDEWTEYEDSIIVQKEKELGPRWNAIARFFKGRSGNSIRNRYLMIMRHKEKKEKLSKKENKVIEAKQSQFIQKQVPMDQIEQEMPQQISEKSFFGFEKEKQNKSAEEALEKSINSIFDFNENMNLFGSDDFDLLSSCMF